jgi:hypothetical protein
MENIKAEFISLYKSMPKSKVDEHPELVEEAKKVEMKKKEKIWMAEIWRKYQSECIERLYLSEKQSITEEYEVNKA